MIKKLLVLLVLVLLALGSLGQLGGSQSGDPKAFMQAKLTHSQKVLEGMVTESYDTIAEHASSLMTLSQDTDWNVIQTAEYRRQSDTFRRHTRALQQAAKEKNVDRASLAYIQLTLSCIECHKHIRHVRQLQNKGP